MILMYDYIGDWLKESDETLMRFYPKPGDIADSATLGIKGVDVVRAFFESLVPTKYTKFFEDYIREHLSISESGDLLWWENLLCSGGWSNIYHISCIEFEFGILCAVRDNSGTRCAFILSRSDEQTILGAAGLTPSTKGVLPEPIARLIMANKEFDASRWGYK